MVYLNLNRVQNVLGNEEDLDLLLIDFLQP